MIHFIGILFFGFLGSMIIKIVTERLDRFMTKIEDSLDRIAQAMEE